MTARHSVRRLATLWLLALGVMLGALAPAAARSTDPIPLPNGFQPEGIDVSPNGTFYAGSLADGTILRGDVKTGEWDVLVTPPAGRISVGLEVSGGLLFVAGGPTGAFVYDAATGETVRTYDVGAGGFVNDVVVTRDAAWFTNSAAAELYRVPLSGGSPGDAETLELTGDFELEPGFNLNGIEATPNGRWLVVVQSNTGELFRVDPATGETVEIDLRGASVSAGDGLLLQGRTLFVVRNQLNAIAVVRLSGDLSSGRLVNEITSPDFDVPTTLGRQGGWLYVIQARFGTAPIPETEYWIAVVPRH
jgi:streptogramin lyase